MQALPGRSPGSSRPEPRESSDRGGWRQTLSAVADTGPKEQTQPRPPLREPIRRKSSGTNIGGTLYSPKGLVKVDGGGAAAGNAAIQIIAWQFDVGGNSGLDMPYDPNGLYHFDSKGL